MANSKYSFVISHPKYSFVTPKFSPLKWMMNIIISLIVIALLVWWLHWSGLELFIGLIAGLLPSIILIYQRKQDREENHRKWLLQNKEACAIELVDIFISPIIDANNKIENQSKEEKLDEMETKFKNLLPAVISWGRPNLIKAWEEIIKAEAMIKTKSTGTYADEIAGEIPRQGERFLRAMRESLGHDDNSLKPGALLALLVPQPEIKEEIYKACEGETYD